MNLEDVITDAVNDSQVEETTPTPEVDVETPVEASSDPVEPVETQEATSDTPTEEPAPDAVEKAVEATPQQDPFEKLVGVPQMGVGGRENRIPYSRVKKISEKAASDAVGEVAEAVIGRKLAKGEKALDVVKAHVAKLPELETKVTDYESRLERVGQFEDVMANQPERFLRMLAKVPAYKDFFEFVERALQSEHGQSTAATPATQTAAASDGMPEPDEELSDGSKIYSIEGIKKLLAWNAAQTEARVTKQIEERYKPIESEWQYNQRIQSVMPVIRKQIEEAKTWPLFSEHEEEITKVLAEDQSISLEGAYRKVVFPKLTTDRNKMRDELLNEIKSAPKATAVTGTTKPAPSVATGPRNIEDIIAEQVATLKNR
jgi:hypothetical protein